MWPRSEIYDLTGETWWLRWSAPLFVGLSLIIGAVYFFQKRLHRRIELAYIPQTHIHRSKVASHRWCKWSRA